MTDLLELVKQVQVAAEAVVAGHRGGDNLELRRAMRNLNRVAEPPAERMRRVIYQVNLDI